MENLTHRQLEALASYMTTHRECSRDLRRYIQADDKAEVLADLWDKYKEHVKL